MARQNKTNWLPERETTASGEARRIGIEIEFSGVEPAVITQLIIDLYGGKTVETQSL